MAMDDETRRLIEEAGLPPEALPSDLFFSPTAEREIDRAKAAAAHAALANAAGAGADGAAAGDGFAEGGSAIGDPAYQAAFAAAQRQLDARAAAGEGADADADAPSSFNAVQARRADVTRAAETAGIAAPPLKIGVLISGSGTNLQALIDRIADGSLNAEIVLVVSSRPSAKGLQRAEAAGLQTLTLSREIYADPLMADEVIASELYRAGADYVIMAGYMRMVHAPLLASFPDRIINLHPALLPSFPGAHAIQDAFDHGVKVTGVTVHIANEVYDQGPIIAQEPVRVEEGWTVDELEAAIHAVEHELYPHVVGLLADGRVRLTPGRTTIVE